MNIETSNYLENCIQCKNDVKETDFFFEQSLCINCKYRQDQEESNESRNNY